MKDVLRYAAFTSDPAGGNPAGIVLHADGLRDDEMQRIAADVGYSETAFLFRADRTPPRYGLRFFSPLDEVAFCGHATIATAVALAERGATGTVVFETPVGDIEVGTERVDGVVRASLTSVETHSRPVSDAVLGEALQALRWSPERLADDLPPQVAYAGNEHLVLAVRSRPLLADLDYDFDRLKTLMTRERWTTLQLIWVQDETTVHSRNPFPVGGVVEDPATGAAAAALGGYLLALGLVRRPRTVRVLQGYDMGRPSELLVGLRPDDTRVTVSGTAVELTAARL
ncbi:phenazine biosynthesis protein PhzF [Intrasporangium oryzae NRRL B-24470]|uniref:Phenazine biosynthesis protein PhzF n=1 Tax=Intrasporangium oryzae NRRL B-24470 TaxID=1386089 RepID=W9GDG5_9MICO|nr:PhzF family phenazine biosynthesis isomerase [Intrasporangium oryzae]EWT01904.1 phenazine biosynthesis protein PhzF [Intrasporangium oryzae NRRL B-24470]